MATSTQIDKQHIAFEQRDCQSDSVKGRFFQNFGSQFPLQTVVLFVGYIVVSLPSPSWVMAACASVFNL